MKAVHYYISQLIALTHRLGPSLAQHGLIYVAVRSDNDFVCIEGQSYQSAHHAAFGEANLFLQRFRGCLPVDFWIENTFDPAVIIENWDRARNEILNRLSQRWQDDFKDVKDRIRRERDAIAEKTKFPSQPPRLQTPNQPVVNLELNQIRFEGECHDVTAEGARLVDCLNSSYPDWFPTEKNGFTKASDTKESLPAPIRKLIETGPGKGYRLKIK